MPKQYGDYTESVDSGLAIQDVFIKSLKKYLKDYPGTNIRTSTLYEDKNKHIDVVCSRGNTTVTFDVKEQKKLHRYDDKPSDVYTWVELQNNYGGKGWIYGSEKYLAFEKGNSFIIVDRVKLLNLVVDNKKEPILYSNKVLSPYMQYQRKNYGNLDINVLVPYNDIIKISHSIIDKCTDI